MGTKKGKHVKKNKIEFTFLFIFHIFINMRYKHTKEDLEEAVKKSLSIAGVCRELKIKVCGGNYKTLYFKFKEWNIDISHFTGNAWNQGENYKPFGKKYDLVSILIEDSTYRSSDSLKKRLYKEGLKTKQCEICKIIEWNNKELIFELDHINGINTDNRIDNLRILCPNCHSQTTTYSGKNNKKTLMEKFTCNQCGIEKKFKRRKCNECEKNKIEKKNNEKILNNGYTDKQIEHFIKRRKIERPSKEILIDEVKELGYCGTGRKYGVSDNCIKKWIKSEI